MGTRPAKQPVIMAGRLLAMMAGSRLASEAELVKAGTPTNLVQADHPARRRLDDPLWRRANHQIALLEKLLQSPAGAVFSPSLNGATGTNVSITNFHRCFYLHHFHPGPTTCHSGKHSKSQLLLSPPQMVAPPEKQLRSSKTIFATRPIVGLTSKLEEFVQPADIDGLYQSPGVLTMNKPIQGEHQGTRADPGAPRTTRQAAIFTRLWIFDQGSTICARYCLPRSVRVIYI